MNNLPKTVKVILWILFWYYLGPYYLLKNYVFKNNHHKILWSSISTIAILFVLFSAWGNSLPDEEEPSSQAPQVHYVTKKVGSKELARAKVKQKSLTAEEKKKQEEYDKLSAQLSSEEEKEKQHQAELKREEKAREKETRANEAASHSTKKSTSHGEGAGNHGDMNTAETGKIVGNVNSKIYHVPGQAGYRMNSSNAVYFNSEQEAIAAGYRKAKR